MDGLIFVGYQFSWFSLKLFHEFQYPQNGNLTFMAGAPPGHLVSPLICRGPWMSTAVPYGWCHSDSASVLLYFTFSVWIMNENSLATNFEPHKSVYFFFLYFTFLSHLFPLPCAGGSTSPREEFDSSVILPFYTPVFRRDVLWYGDVRPSVRPPAHLLHFSHTCFDIMSWNFAHDFVFMY